MGGVSSGQSAHVDISSCVCHVICGALLFMHYSSKPDPIVIEVACMEKLFSPVSVC